MKKPVYLFDMNGVIIDDEHLHQAATRQTLVAHGYACSAADYKQYFAGRTRDAGFASYKKARQASFDVHQLSVEKDQAYQRLAQEGLRTVGHVVDYISHLGAQGGLLAVVTGAPRREAKHVLETFGLSDYFSQVITGEDITLSKPHPEGYLKAAAMLQVAPADCIVVEDAPMGVRAAHRAGMRCIAVTTTHDKEELAAADWVVPRLTADMFSTFAAVAA